MKKKFLSLVLAVGLMVTVLSGCSLFATPADKSGDNSGNSGSTGAIEMTDKYTFEDPAGLDFDKRYVLYCDENSQMIASAPAEYGILASYSITYAKDDAPVASYDFYICDSAEHAQATTDLYASQGSTLTAAESDPCVIGSSTDGDTLEANLVTFQSYGMISEATVSAYVAFMQTSLGGTILN